MIDKGYYTLLRPEKRVNAMNQTLKKILNIITWPLIVIVVLFAVLLVGVRIIGFQPFAVLSGSMEPDYSVGDLIYVRSVDPFELKEGDVITYMMSETTVSTHRIVEVVPDETDTSVVRFKTKGDANDTEDGSLVHYKNVIGTPRFAIPLLGYVAAYISSPPGLYVAIGLGALLIVLVFLPDLFPKEERKRGRFERLDD